MFKLIQNGNELVSLLLSIEDEQSFLEQLNQHAHQLDRKQNGQVSRTLLEDLIKHTVEHNWREATSTIFDLGITHYTDLWVWRNGVVHLKYVDLADWFLEAADRMEVGQIRVLRFGSNDLAAGGPSDVFSYWVEQCLLIHPEMEWDTSCAHAVVSGRLDNVAVVLPKMTEKQIASVLLTAAGHDQVAAIDFLYSSASHELVSHLIAVREQQGEETTSGILYLKQKIASDVEGGLLAEHVGSMGTGLRGKKI